MKDFLVSLLRQVDSTAEIAELTADSDGFGYTIQLRTHGELGKPRSLSAGLLTMAQNGNAVAIRSVRVLLSAMLLEIRSRQAQDSARLARHDRWRRPPKSDLP